MAKTDPRVDTYIAKSQPFAHPILMHIRQVVLEAFPEIEETIKWGFPHFDYNGMIVCSMASFKQHCAFGFYKEKLMNDPDRLFDTGATEGMGSLGKIKSITDLPSDKILKKYILEAVRLNKEGIRLSPTKPRSETRKEPEVGEEFKILLDKNPKAKAVFASFSPSAKREYLDWFNEAKTSATSEKRMNTAIEWIAEGKQRNWKYMK